MKGGNFGQYDERGKEYEGIIAMSQAKLQEAKNSLVSSGATVKNFGMQVGSNGQISFFATLEKANSAKAKYIEKKQTEKKATKAKEKKQAEKKAQNERLEKLREGNKTEKEYIELWSEDLDDLVNNVAKYTYNHSMDNVLTEEETRVGQNVDFKG